MMILPFNFQFVNYAKLRIVVQTICSFVKEF